MEIYREKSEAYDVVAAKGRLDSTGVEELSKVFRQIIDEGRYQVVFDMAGVSYITAAGIWLLMETQKECKKSDRGEILLAALSEKVKRNVELAGMRHFFTLIDTVDEAAEIF